MPESTEVEREYEIRALAAYPSDAPWRPDVVPFLLRLLDAERVRADAAEARVASAWDYGLVSGIGYCTRVHSDADAWEPSNPHRR